MTKTLTQHLETIKREGKGIFLPYIMAGDHEKGLAGLPETIAFLENLGVSSIEIGLPFSDPVADGPVIEEAGLRRSPYFGQVFSRKLAEFGHSAASHHHDLL